MKINFLSNKIPWFGNHTGYEQLPQFLQNFSTKTQIYLPRARLLERCLGKAYSIYRGWSKRNSYHAAAELKFFLSSQTKQSNIDHILYLENHLLFLDNWAKAPVHLIGTIHLPPSQWKSSMLENLKRLSSAIVLYQRDLQFFENYIGQNRVKFIHHGVDIDFFYPVQQQLTQIKSILFAGHYLRNTEMLHRIVVRLTERYPQLHFDFLVPDRARDTGGLVELKNHPSVTWHQKLSDEALRQLYQRSYLLLLPMNDSGANTAVVEALACGLPIVTTDVGGIRDYGGGSVYPIILNNDDGAMLELVDRYLTDLEWRNIVARNCREFAEQHLAWSLIAQKHLESYSTLLV